MKRQGITIQTKTCLYPTMCATLWAFLTPNETVIWLSPGFHHILYS